MKDKRKRKRNGLKIFFFIVFFLLIWLIYYNRDSIIPLLEKYPLIWPIYTFIELQIEQKSLIGLAALSFFGSLFFIFLPIEVTYLFYLSLGYNTFVVFIVAIPCYMVGLTFNYFFGFLLGERLFFKEKDTKKMQKRINTFGSFIIILGYLLFLPMEFVILALGAFRYPFKKFFILVFIMVSIRFVFVLLLRDYFMANILPKIAIMIPGIQGFF